MSNESWLTLSEYAAEIRKSQRWVEEACTRSEIYHHKVGRDLRFSPADRARNDELTARGPRTGSADELAADDSLERALAGLAVRRGSKSTAASAAA